MRKHIAVLSIVFLVLTGIIFYGSAQFLFQKTKQDIQNAAINRIISAIQNATPSIERIINDSADIKKDMLLIIALTEYIHDLADKVENINSVFILDADKNLLATSNTADSLSIEKRAGLYDNAIMKNTDMTQPVDLESDSEGATNQEAAESAPENNERPINNNNAIFLYSTPINDNYTLFCEILLQEGINKARYWRNWYYFPGAAVIAVVLTVILYFLTQVILGIPYNRLKRALEKSKRRQEEERSLMQDEMQRWQEQESRRIQEEAIYKQQKAERQEAAAQIMDPAPEFETAIVEQKPEIEDSPVIISDDKYNEMANLFIKENEKKAKMISDLERDKNGLRDFFRHFLSDLSKQTQIYAAIDASNKVIFAKDETGRIFKSSRIAPGTKFGDIILIPEMSQYISPPSSEPNKEISIVINDEIDISFKAVYVKGGFVGTIISSS
jgi:hypothetical protein